MTELSFVPHETIGPYQAQLDAEKKVRRARLHIVQKPLASVVTEITIERQIQEAKTTIRKAFAGRIAIAEIKKVVAKHFEITVDGLIGPRRLHAVTWPRQIAMYLCKTLTPFGFPFIGHQFGRHHTTVLYAERKVGAMRESDTAFNAQIEAIIRKIKGED